MKRVVHFEINADQPERAARFYSGAFGWKVEKDEGHDYWLVRTGSGGPGIDGGLVRRIAPAASTVDIVEIPALESTRVKIQQLGGDCFMPTMSVDGVGLTTYCRDTEGNIFGLLQPLTRPA